MVRKMIRFENVDIKDIPTSRKGGRSSEVARIIVEFLGQIPKGTAVKILDTGELKPTSIDNFLALQHRKGNFKEYTHTQRKVDGKILMFVVRAKGGLDA